MNCRVVQCNGPMDGQMMACAPHWSLLSEELRHGLLAANDQLVSERRVGNVHRATRMWWKELLAKADAEWHTLRLVLYGPGPSSSRGIDWVRKARQLATEADAQAVAASDG